ncbi:[FeFe] hydrogenase H-cluster radical SAM maturase HydE [Spirochaeta cellobiosiphila]|uniref:[FeFe] hydrogenase H-cluster radical SAM maturase HydE n=1 Tax=Spirochaeta cellobiosiphila TaxID=504483 RepID=UPI00069FC66F|nr:[FeFe] hydrogenase H-cluster radical SAM maturase HydE [Spirochaeta cellobiosiphila]
MLSTSSAIEYYKNDPSLLYKEAYDICQEVFQDKVYIRGLIEYTNYCTCDCQYCGIRRSNSKVNRYRLSIESILNVIDEGVKKGIKTFVLQGGEDPEFNTKQMLLLLTQIRKKYGNSLAITLSCGQKTKQDYQDLFEAGANRYLMRFETSNQKLYERMKNGQKLSSRLNALENLKAIGYETGSGYMTGLPSETDEVRINNALMSKEFGFDMLGIGPFIPHPDTPLGTAKQEPLEYAIRGTALLRVLLPYSNIPATTAAGTLEQNGREQMLKAGANVLMPNLTPTDNKKDYLLYPNKICIDESGFQCIGCMTIRTLSIGKKISLDRGDSQEFHRRQNVQEPN